MKAQESLAACKEALTQMAEVVRLAYATGRADGAHQESIAEGQARVLHGKDSRPTWETSGIPETIQTILAKGTK